MLLMLVFCVFVSYSQDMKTPRFHIIEKDTIGILISISDAQKLDNDGEILKIYERLAISYDETGVKYLTIIDNLGNQVATLKLEILESGKIITTQKGIIVDLKQIISIHETDRELASVQSANKDIIIKNLERKVNRSFWQKIGGSAIALTVIAFLIVK